MVGPVDRLRLVNDDADAFGRQSVGPRSGRRSRAGIARQADAGKSTDSSDDARESPVALHVIPRERPYTGSID
jgi:hypothetical protein